MSIVPGTSPTHQHAASPARPFPADFLAVSPYSVTSPQPSLAFKLRFQAFPGSDPPVQQPNVGKGSWSNPIVVKDGPAGLPYLSPILYVSCAALRCATLHCAVVCSAALHCAVVCSAVL